MKRLNLSYTRPTYVLAKVFLGFLNDIIDKYPTGKIVIILYNARIDHAKLI